MGEAPERIWAAPGKSGGWAEAYAGDWPSPGNPQDTLYIRSDLSEAAECRGYERGVRELYKRLSELRMTNPKSDYEKGYNDGLGCGTDAALDVIRKDAALQFLADEGQKCDAMQEVGAGVKQDAALLKAVYDACEKLEQVTFKDVRDNPMQILELIETTDGDLSSALGKYEPAAPTVQEAARVINDEARRQYDKRRSKIVDPDWDGVDGLARSRMRYNALDAALRALADGEAE